MERSPFDTPVRPSPARQSDICWKEALLALEPGETPPEPALDLLRRRLEGGA